jgi:hypothetical protein
MKPYKGGKTSMVFYLPRQIADVIPPDADFEPELTDDGVLFRFIGFEEQTKDGVPVPEWAKRS